MRLFVPDVYSALLTVCVRTQLRNAARRSICYTMSGQPVSGRRDHQTPYTKATPVIRWVIERTRKTEF